MNSMTEEKLKDILRPSNLFKTEKDLLIFIENGKKDAEGKPELFKQWLNDMLKACEKDECYEYCSIIMTEIEKIQ
jgi:hypothetical protein